MVDEIYASTGPVLLLAAPGTGKTHNLARRVKWLVETREEDPDSIAVITFTDAAASNMRNRLSDRTLEALYVPPRLQPRSICTMHSLGYSIIIEQRANTGQTAPRVIGSSTGQVLLGDAAQIAGYARSAAHETADCRTHGRCEREEAAKCRICDTYRALLDTCAHIDLDDQILLACAALREEPHLLAEFRGRCRHLLIDEYQDINESQHQLIRLLSSGQEDGLFAVGDDDQSIYSWRGGSPEFIRRFSSDFGDEAHVEPLQVSYRCHEHILEGARAVVCSYDPDRLDKGLTEYAREDGPQIAVHSVATDDAEADQIAEITKRSWPSMSVLILVPNRFFVPRIATRLAQRRIPFLGRAEDHPEGFVILDELELWLSDEADNLALRTCAQRWVDSKASGIPSSRSRKDEKLQEREEALRELAQLWRPVLEGSAGSLWRSLMDGARQGRYTTALACALSECRALRSSDDAGGFLTHAMATLGFWRSPDDLVRDICQWARAQRRRRLHGDLLPVRIMSHQGAKGLEADVVCVAGLEEGALPRANLDDDKLAEAARLFYVSATRAVEQLHLFHARRRSSQLQLRNIYAGKDPPDLAPSRFLVTIPKEHLEKRYHRGKTR